MKTCDKLPPSYKSEPAFRIETESDRKLSRRIKAVSAAAAVALLGTGCVFLPPEALTHMDKPFERLISLVMGMLLVSTVHELIRGLVMRICSGTKPILKFSGGYLYAGSEVFFGRGCEFLINLAPFALMTAALTAVLLSISDLSSKWIIWMVMTVEICTCLRDGYVCIRLLKLPESILIENVGPSFLVFAEQEKQGKKPE